MGKGIPKHITGLPAEFLNSPFGQMIRPQIEAMFGQSGHGTIGSSPILEESFVRCTNISVLREIIESNPHVAIEFTNKACSDCQAIAPKFENLMRDKNGQHLKIVGVSVETTIARDIMHEFGIVTTPTYLFYLNGKKVSEFSGAHYAKLKTAVENLVGGNTADSNLSYNLHLGLLGQAPVHFNISSNHDLIFKKLFSFLNDGVLKEHHPKLEQIKLALESSSFTDPILLANYTASLFKVMEVLGDDQLFPALDILRQLALHIVPKKNVLAEFWVNYDQILLRIAKNEGVGKASTLMMLKLVILDFN